MRRFVTGFVLSAALAASPALAEDTTLNVETNSQEPGITEPTLSQPGVSDPALTEPGISQATSDETGSNRLQNEGFGLKPLVGLIAFTDTVGQSTSRGLVGLQMDWNIARAFAYKTPLYIGLDSGVM